MPLCSTEQPDLSFSDNGVLVCYGSKLEEIKSHDGVTFQQQHFLKSNVSGCVCHEHNTSRCCTCSVCMHWLGKLLVLTAWCLKDIVYRVMERNSEEKVLLPVTVKLTTSGNDTASESWTCFVFFTLKTNIAMICFYCFQLALVKNRTLSCFGGTFRSWSQATALISHVWHMRVNLNAAAFTCAAKALWMYQQFV